MATELITSIVGACGAIAVACLSYGFTKKKEREAELRKEKLEHYKEFVASLSVVSFANDNGQAQIAFANACNKLNLIAPVAVVRAMQGFQNEVRESNANKNSERIMKSLTNLFREMRTDLGVKPQDHDLSIDFGLWAPSIKDSDVAKEFVQKPKP